MMLTNITNIILYNSFAATANVSIETQSLIDTESNEQEIVATTGLCTNSERQKENISKLIETCRLTDFVSSKGEICAEHFVNKNIELICEGAQSMYMSKSYILKKAKDVLEKEYALHKEVLKRLKSFTDKSMIIKDRNQFYKNVITSANAQGSVEDSENKLKNHEPLESFYTKFLVSLIRQCRVDCRLTILLVQNPDVLEHNLLYRKENIKFVLHDLIYEYVNGKRFFEEDEEAKAMKVLIESLYIICKKTQTQIGISLGHNMHYKNKVAVVFNRFHQASNHESDLEIFLKSATDGQTKGLYKHYPKYMNGETDYISFCNNFHKLRRKEFFDAFRQFCQIADEQTRESISTWEHLYDNDVANFKDVHYSESDTLRKLLEDFISKNAEFKSFIHLGISKAMQEQFFSENMKYMGIDRDIKEITDCPYYFNLMVKPVYYPLPGASSGRFLIDYTNVLEQWFDYILKNKKCTFLFHNSVMGGDCDIRDLVADDEKQKIIDTFFSRSGEFKPYIDNAIMHDITCILFKNFDEITDVIIGNKMPKKDHEKLYWCRDIYLEQITNREFKSEPIPLDYYPSPAERAGQTSIKHHQRCANPLRSTAPRRSEFGSGFLALENDGYHGSGNYSSKRIILDDCVSDSAKSSRTTDSMDVTDSSPTRPSDLVVSDACAPGTSCIDEQIEEELQLSVDAGVFLRLAVFECGRLEEDE